jgi:hypothetical protein
MRAIWRISEAALAPDRWPAALQSITEAVGVSGGNYLFERVGSKNDIAPVNDFFRSSSLC